MGCVPRIGQWLATYGGPDDTTYARAVGELILVAAGRRVRQPGVKFDEMLVLESPQGTNKSTALKALAVRDDWFTDDLPLNAEAKRVIDALSGKWIVEAVELKGMRQGGVNHLKGLLSRTHDNLAPKAEAKACRAGTKQAILVDLLFRSGGASMAELREALAPWKDITIKSGLGWDMNAIKGYGIRTTFENGYQRRLATESAGMCHRLARREIRNRDRPRRLNVSARRGR